MSIQKSLKKVFRPQKYKQDKLQKELAQEAQKAQEAQEAQEAQNKLAQEIAEKINVLCNSFLAMFKSENVTGFPQEKKNVKNFVNYTINKYCQESVNKLNGEYANVIAELDKKSFQDLEWKHKNFLLSGEVGKNFKVLLDDASDEYKSKFEFQQPVVENANIINLVQKPLRVQMFFQSVKEFIDNNKDSKLNDVVNEFKCAIDKDTENTLKNKEVGNDILKEVISVTAGLIGKFNKSDIWDIYDLILKKQNQLKDEVKKEAKRYSSSKRCKNIKNYKSQLNNMIENVK